MISAFARGAQVLGDTNYLEAATRAAEFVRDKLYDAKTHTLRRSYRGGPAEIGGFAEDYAFYIQGLLDLVRGLFRREMAAPGRAIAGDAGPALLGRQERRLFHQHR